MIVGNPPSRTKLSTGQSVTFGIKIDSTFDVETKTPVKPSKVKISLNGTFIG